MPRSATDSGESRRCKAWLLLFLIAGREVAALRQESELSGADLLLDSDELVSSEQSAEFATAKAVQLAASEGEAVRGKLKYWKYGSTSCVSTIVKGGCWESHIFTLERGSGGGEAVMKIYEDSGKAKELYAASKPMMLDPSVQPKHVVSIPSDRIVGMDPEGKLTLRVDTAKSGWSRSGSQLGLDLYIDPDDTTLQLRQTVSPRASLNNRPTTNTEDLLSVWMVGIRSLQAVGTCLLDGTCHVQCTYVDEMDGCTPARMCRQVDSDAYGKQCKPLTGDAAQTMGWQRWIGDVKQEVDGVSECFATCKEQWKSVLQSVKLLTDFRDSILKPGTKQLVEQTHPNLVAEMEGHENDIHEIFRLLSNAFDANRQGTMAPLRWALKSKGCNIEEGALQQALIAANSLSGDALADTLSNVMKDCTAFEQEAGKSMTEMALEEKSTDAQMQQVAPVLNRLSESDEGSAIKKVGGSLLESTAHLENLHGAIIRQSYSDSLVQQGKEGLADNSTVAVGACDPACMAIVGPVLAAALWGIAIGLLMIIFGKILCWMGAKLLMSGKTADQAKLQNHRMYQCATWMNRIGAVLMILGIIVAIICIAIICSGGNLLQIEGSSSLNSGSLLQIEGNSSTLTTGCEGGGSMSSPSGTTVNVYPSYYWFWWDMPPTPTYSHGYTDFDWDFEREQEKQRRQDEAELEALKARMAKLEGKLGK